MPRLLHLHGPPRLAHEAGELALSAREAALLAWLHLEGPTPRGRIAGLLWPGGTEAQARANLRQTLARLKRAAGALVAEDGGVLRLALDVAPAEGAAPLLGPLAFDDAPEFAAWLSTRRDDALRRHQRESLAAALASLDRGDADAALAAADALLATHPESEEAWRLRMEALFRRGDRAAALQAFDDCRLALRAAFGVAPSAATLALGQRILSGSEPAPATPGALPAALRRPPQLVGRDDLLATLQHGLALGHGAVLLGPGGIGKTRLIAELAQRHAPALVTGARPGDAARPGALLARLVGAALRRFEPVLDAATQADLARLLPAAPGQAEPADLKSALEHRRVIGAVTRALQACGRGEGGLRLIAVDDLHFADDASLDALQVIAGAWLAAPPDAAPVPLFAARADELPAAAAPLLDLLGASGRAARIELAPLAREQVQGLVSEVMGTAAPLSPALAEALHAQVGGNPAFVLESLKSLWLEGLAAWQPGQPLPVPPTLREAVRRRLQHLSPEALQLAQLAAVAEGDFEPALAAAAFGRTLLALAPLLVELERAQVFDGQGSFGHDLVAEAVRATLPAALAEALHALVAEHLGGQGGAPGSIARHLQAARRPHEAARWHLAVAREARARWLMADAAAAFEAAARGLTQPGDRAEAFAAWCEAARCALWANREPAARVALDAAAPLQRGAAEAAAWQALQVSWLFATRQLGDALSAARTLLEMLQACIDELALADVVQGLRALGSLVPHGLPHEPALALAERAGARRPTGAPAVLLLSVRAGLLQWALRPREAETDLAAAWQQLADGDDPGQRVQIANQLMRVRHGLGDLPGAARVAQSLLDEAAQLQLGLVFQCDVMHVLAMVDVAAGRPAAGLARFDTLLVRLQAAGEKLPDAFACALALVHIALGRHAEARRWLEERHPARGQHGFLLPDIAWALTRVKLAVRSGEDPLPWLAQVPALDPLPPALQLQCTVALATLRPGVPLAELQALAARLQALGLAGMRRVVLVAAVHAAQLEGQLDEACALAAEALALADAVDGWLDEPASVWAAAAQAYAAAGRSAQAREVAAAGAAWVLERAEGWTRAEDRDAWCHGNPLHRELLARAGRLSGR